MGEYYYYISIFSIDEAFPFAAHERDFYTIQNRNELDFLLPTSSMSDSSGTSDCFGQNGD